MRLFRFRFYEVWGNLIERDPNDDERCTLDINPKYIVMIEDIGNRRVRLDAYRPNDRFEEMPLSMVYLDYAKGREFMIDREVADELRKVMLGGGE